MSFARRYWLYYTSARIAHALLTVNYARTTNPQPIFLTNLGLCKILRAMFRRALALLLVTSWAVLSAVDVLEDLNLGAYPEVHASEKSGFPGFGRAAQSANNIVENGSRHIVNPAAGLIAPTAGDNVGFRPCEKEAKTLKKNLRIYKLHKAFLI